MEQRSDAVNTSIGRGHSEKFVIYRSIVTRESLLELARFILQHNPSPLTLPDQHVITHAKRSSSIETLRKPASRVVAAIFVFCAMVTVPRALGSVFGEILELTGYSLLIAAALGRVWCAIYISGRKDRVLCQDGPYSLCRNPLYFFSLLGVVGFFAALENGVFAVAAAVVYLGYYRYVILSEEMRLAQLFGPDYASYAASTPRFFPALRAPQGIDSYTIRPKIIERSLKEVVWFLLVIVFAEVLERIHEAGYMILYQLPF